MTMPATISPLHHHRLRMPSAGWTRCTIPAMAHNKETKEPRTGKKSEGGEVVAKDC
jgi:hypothetical protein